MELDHFFILTEPLARQAELLSDIGLIEGTPNDHPGQGKCQQALFFLHSALELLYVRDALEADRGPARRLRFPARASDSNASPFGLIFRGNPGFTTTPFAGWYYQPDYFGPDWSFLVGDNSDVLAEPLCIYMPFDAPPQSTQPLSNEPFATISEIRISVPVAKPSSVLEAVSKVKQVSFRTCTDHLLEVVFNNENDRQIRDLRPALPMLIRW